VGSIFDLCRFTDQTKYEARLQRNEHNSTMAQWTVIRMAIARNRDIAELMTAGLHGERAIDAADQLRLEQMLAETNLGGFSHLGQNAARYLSEGDFRSDGWSTAVRLAQNGGWRDLVAHRQNRRGSPLGSSWTSTPRSPGTLERPPG